jgi:protein-S-isoprenylcysteine O-methyltransferase Ste14
MFRIWNIRLRLWYHVSNAILIWAAVLLYRSNIYYSGFLRAETQNLLLWTAAVYSVIGLIVYLLLPERQLSQSKGAIVIMALKRFSMEMKDYFFGFPRNPKQLLPALQPNETRALLFILVKLFFLPIMLNFFFSNLNSTISNFLSWDGQGFAFSIFTFNKTIYPLLLSAIFVLDTAFFVFGYSFEAPWLRNTIRSVEPTFFGWAVALVCYPPFSGFFGTYVSSYASDYAVFQTELSTFGMRIIVIAAFFVYLWATLALGTRCSNLTNRGIVSKGPYAIIRHPAYVSKNIAWWTTIIPLIVVLGPLQVAAVIASTVVWTCIYFFRAITEERHLIKDTDYQEYCRKVKYRFIPYVF